MCAVSHAMAQVQAAHDTARDVSNVLPSEERIGDKDAP